MGKKPTLKPKTKKASGGNKLNIKKASAPDEKGLKIKKIAPRKASTVRIMSWNIQGTYADDSKIANVSSKRTAKATILGRVIAAAEPDVFSVQEVAGGSIRQFEKEFKKALPKGYDFQYHNDQPKSKGQRYMIVHKKGIKIEFKGFPEYKASLKKANTLEIEAATTARRPLSLRVTKGSTSFTMSTWHAPHGNEMLAREANRLYGTHLNGEKTNEEHVLVGDLNITSADVRSTYSLASGSIASNGRFDHVASLKGTQVTSLSSLPTKRSLKQSHGYQVSDHSMMGADVPMAEW